MMMPLKKVFLELLFVCENLKLFLKELSPAINKNIADVISRPEEVIMTIVENNSVVRKMNK